VERLLGAERRAMPNQPFASAPSGVVDPRFGAKLGPSPARTGGVAE
jgi:hypothetical protein